MYSKYKRIGEECRFSFVRTRMKDKLQVMIVDYPFFECSGGEKK